MKSRTITQLQTKLLSQKGKAGAELETWKEKFALNPVYALTWADDSYVQAARFEQSIILLQRLEAIDSGKTEEEVMESMHKAVLKEVLRLATQNTSRSTSASHNLVEAAKVEVWASLLEWFTDLYA